METDSEISRLHEFLAGNRERILALARIKGAALSKSKQADAAVERRLPEFYHRLVGALDSEGEGGGLVARTPHAAAKARRGKERPGPWCSLSQVACALVVIRQAITETSEVLGVALSPLELRALNRSLDAAIAEAVTANKGAHRQAANFDEATRMGFLVHELRNALSCVFVAHALIKKAPGGSNALLERNLQHMRSMLDRASIEVRLHKEPPARRRPMPVIDVVREVVATAAEEARIKGVTLSVRVDHRIMVNADAPYLASALANLVQNAVKFTNHGGVVWVRGLERDNAAVLEVEDQCGGLPVGKIEKLFEPFIQMGEDRSGLGLGLAISRRAVSLNSGTLSVRDIPGKGCVFSIILPRVRGSALVGPRAARDVTARSQ